MPIRTEPTQKRQQGQEARMSGGARPNEKKPSTIPIQGAITGPESKHMLRRDKDSGKGGGGCRQERGVRPRHVEGRKIVVIIID